LITGGSGHLSPDIARRLRKLAIVAVIFAAGAASASAQQRYDPGASDTEIRIGNIMPYSGPASAYGIIGRTMSAYFRMVNDNGGINGRTVEFISYDDGYNPSRAVEQARRLVEADEVLAIFAPFGTASNAAIQRYMNNRHVPQLFAISGASRWADPVHFPWTIGWLPSYRTEARIYADYILTHHPGARIGILYQNDDFGRDYLAGLKEVLQDRYAQMVVASLPYEISEPTIDSQIVAIKAAAPDIFINVATPKFAAQAIRKLAELDWHPVHIMTNVSVSVGSVLKLAGLDNAKGVLSAGYQMDVTDPQWDSYPGMQHFRAFMAKYYPDADRSESGPLVAFNMSSALVEVLRRCGDDLTRERIMQVATNLDIEGAAYIPGVRVKTSPTDFRPIEHLQMMRFTGEKWEWFGPLMNGHSDRITLSPD